MSTQDVVDQVTQDPYARRRVQNSVTIEIRRGIHGILTSVDGDDYAIIACIEDSVDARRFHEAMAATCLEALHELEDLEQGGDQ